MLCGRGNRLVAHPTEAAVEDARQKRVKFILRLVQVLPCWAVLADAYTLGGGLSFLINGSVHTNHLAYILILFELKINSSF